MIIFFYHPFFFIFLFLLKSLPPAEIISNSGRHVKIKMVSIIALTNYVNPPCKNVQQYLDNTFFDELFYLFDIVRRYRFVSLHTASVDPSFFFSVFFSFFLEIRYLHSNYAHFWNVSTYNLNQSWNIWPTLNSRHYILTTFFLTRSASRTWSGYELSIYGMNLSQQS